ncbi:MAG: manganese efflux pump MntP [Planctomycetota bacterium]
MDFLTIFAIAVGLAMDATAVSLAAGVSLQRFGIGPLLRMPLSFGLFQAGMPLIGWLAGVHLFGWIAAWDHWVAFGLLAAVGGKMVFEGAFRRGRSESSPSDPSRGVTLLVLSVATSIDALAVGIGLALLDTPILVPCLIIGGVTVLMSAGGLWFGRRLGLRFGAGMTCAGGRILVAIGVKILIEHGAFCVGGTLFSGRVRGGRRISPARGSIAHLVPRVAKGGKSAKIKVRNPSLKPQELQ